MFGILRRTARREREKQIRLAQEEVAYYTAKADMLQQFSMKTHTTADRDSYIEARSEQRRYEERLAILLEADEV